MSARHSHHIVIFAGPSLYGVDARSILTADYQPPARMGDIYSVLAMNVDVIALIDGVFHGEPSVWHRELLTAVDAGIYVIGSSSMGALRAAELYELGMAGHGIVFNWYRDGVVERDDEVALQHGDSDSSYRPLSEPLVNIRATLLNAVESGVLASTDAQDLIAHAAGQYYPQRSVAGLLDSPTCRGWSLQRREHLIAQLRNLHRDIKREDAVSLLSHLAETKQFSGRSTASSAADQKGYQRVALSFRIVGKSRGATLLSQLDNRPAHLTEHRRSVVISWLQMAWARDAKISCPEGALHDRREHWKRQYKIDDESAWLCRQGLLRSELEDYIRRDAMCAWLNEIGPQHFGISSYITDWARRHGISPPHKARPEISAWLVEREPSAFGYTCDISVELLQFLQCTDQLSLLIDPWPPKAI